MLERSFESLDVSCFSYEKDMQVLMQKKKFKLTGKHAKADKWNVYGKCSEAPSFEPCDFSLHVIDPKWQK